VQAVDRLARVSDTGQLGQMQGGSSLRGPPFFIGRGVPRRLDVPGFAA
jgi:hypothetical protein